MIKPHNPAPPSKFHTSGQQHMRSGKYSLDRIFEQAHKHVMEQTTLFHILSDETRLRALALMHSSGEVCICELVHALELPQPKISRHMAAMRDAGIVLPRRDAQWVFYMPNPDLPDWQKQVIAAAMLGLADNPIIKSDLERLKTMSNRPARCAA